MPLAFLDLPVEIRLLIYDHLVDDSDTTTWTRGFCYQDEDYEGLSLSLKVCWERWVCSEICCCICGSHKYSPGQHKYYPSGFALPIRTNLLSLARVCKKLCKEIMPAFYSRTTLVLHSKGLGLLRQHTRDILVRFPGCKSFRVLQINLNCVFDGEQVKHVRKLLETCFRSVRELRLHLWLDRHRYPRKFCFRESDPDFDVIRIVPEATRWLTENNLRVLRNVIPDHVNIRVGFSNAETHKRNYALLAPILACYQQAAQMASVDHTPRGDAPRGDTHRGDNSRSWAQVAAVRVRES